MISNGTRASTEQITATARRLLYLRTSQIDNSWKIFVQVGKEASNPIWKLLAPIISAKDTRKAPVVSAVMASVVRPSPITSRNPRFISASVNAALGLKFIAVPLQGLRQGLYQWQILFLYQLTAVFKSFASEMNGINAG